MIWFLLAACFTGRAFARDQNGPINPPDTTPPVAPMTGAPLPHYGPRTRIRVGGNVQMKGLVRKVDPVYPKDAKKKHVSGTVVLHVIVAADGSVQSAACVSGPDLLKQAAIDAVKKWRFKPILLNGEPVEVDTTLQVVFALG